MDFEINITPQMSVVISSTFPHVHQVEYSASRLSCAHVLEIIELFFFFFLKHKA